MCQKSSLEWDDKRIIFVTLNNYDNEITQQKIYENDDTVRIVQ